MAYKYKRNVVWSLKRHWESNKLLKSILFALLFMVLGAGIYMFIDNLGIFYVAYIPDLLVGDYTQVLVNADVSDGVGVVVLAADCKQIVAYTEAEQAESILLGLTGQIIERPNTHDLMKDAFDNLGIEVIMLKIVDVRNGTFIGRLILRQGNKILSLDTRPSDGTAIAVRVNAPIYIKDSLLEEYGEDIC